MWLWILHPATGHMSPPCVTPELICAPRAHLRCLRKQSPGGRTRELATGGHQEPLLGPVPAGGARMPGEGLGAGGLAEKRGALLRDAGHLCWAGGGAALATSLRPAQLRCPPGHPPIGPSGLGSQACSGLNDGPVAEVPVTRPSKPQFPGVKYNLPYRVVNIKQEVCTKPWHTARALVPMARLV